MLSAEDRWRDTSGVESHISTWMDSMSTWPSITCGPRDEKGVVNQKGIMQDIITPGGRAHRHVSWSGSEDAMRAEPPDVPGARYSGRGTGTGRISSSTATIVT